MSTDVDDIIRKLNPALRKRVEAQVSELIAGEMALRELRARRRGAGNTASACNLK